MSNVPQQPAPQPVAVRATPGPLPPEEILIVSHSQLFYWWPVWAVAFLMAALTYIDGSLMVTVPAGSQQVVDATILVPGKDAELKGREAIVLPKDGLLQRPKGAKPTDEPAEIKLHMSQSKNYGVIFVFTLLLVIVITNVPLRGMWSMIVIIVLILLSVIFALAGWWEYIFEKLGRLDIRINAGGYIITGVVLLAIWLFTMLFFDRQIYIVFSQSQFKVCTEIGGGEKVYSTVGLQLERQRSDLFRHYILGLGSGDLIVRTSGAQAHHFDLVNVLFISKKMQQIETLLKTQRVDVTA